MVVGIALCAMHSLALAHGLLARVRTEGAVILGTAYYSSGDPAGGEWVEFFDVSAGDAKVAAFPADPGGNFRFEGVAGHAYRVAVHGDEGHFIELQISLQAGARAKLVEPESAPKQVESEAPPAWAVVGGVLLLVSLAAAPYRLRKRRPKVQLRV
jgi:hypothetical protein